MRIAVGLSGGVDSSVAALLLKAAGHDVFGITMRLWPDGAGQGSASAVRPGRNACFGPDEAEDIEMARLVCGRLGIPFHVFDCSKAYEDLVLCDFREEYRRGRTPNPCVLCNQAIKFGLLPRLAEGAGLDFDRFATGHYARVEQDAGSGRFLLKKGTDERKDQSYFLYRLSGEQLARTIFPLGAYTKDRVRRMAEDAGLPVKDKKDSQDFYCGDLDDILGPGAEEGDIVDRLGTVLGRHRGVRRYTIGQRRGLGLSSAVPLYVTRIDAVANRLVVGPEDETFSRSCTVSDCRWTACDGPEDDLEAEVKVRSSSPGTRAAISGLGKDRARVVFSEPLSAVTPGQSAVFYRGDIVLGGGLIGPDGE